MYSSTCQFILSHFICLMPYMHPNHFYSCQDNVHGNVRLAFHDASGFSQALKDAGQFA